MVVHGLTPRRSWVINICYNASIGGYIAARLIFKVQKQSLFYRRLARPSAADPCRAVFLMGGWYWRILYDWRPGSWTTNLWRGQNHLLKCRGNQFLSWKLQSNSWGPYYYIVLSTRAKLFRFNRWWLESPEFNWI